MEEQAGLGAPISMTLQIRAFGCAWDVHTVDSTPKAPPAGGGLVYGKGLQNSILKGSFVGSPRPLFETAKVHIVACKTDSGYQFTAFFLDAERRLTGVFAAPWDGSQAKAIGDFYFTWTA